MKTIKFLGCTTILLFFISIAFSQNKPSVKPVQSFAAVTSSDEILAVAKEINSRAGTNGWKFLTKNKVTSVNQKRMIAQIKKGRSIIDRVIKLGSKMTNAEAARYDAQMHKVVETMDALKAANTANGSQGECFGSCDNQYKGWGHGKGWNRFWCKASCFKIEVHVG